MKLPHWIWALNTAGATAVTNLAGFGLLGVLHLVLFREGIIRVDHEPAWRIAIADGLRFSMVFLAFPLGWASILFCPVGAPWAAIVFVPLNAYLWGWIADAVWQRRTESANWLLRWKDQTLHRCSNPSCLAQFEVDLSPCPSCGTPAPVPTPRSILRDRWNYFVFIKMAGLIAPLVTGGLATAMFGLGELFVAFASVVVGAAFILSVVRLLNRRHDPRRVRSLVEPSDPKRESR